MHYLTSWWKSIKNEAEIYHDPKHKELNNLESAENQYDWEDYYLDKLTLSANPD